MTERTNLIIIDPQNDFCEPRGSLYVNNAAIDMLCLSDLLNNEGNKINNIFVSLDTHNVIDISHPLAWQDKVGYNPEPLTIITLDNILDETWSSIFSLEHIIKYLKALKEAGKVHCIWPEHCIIGTWGHGIQESLMLDLIRWQKRNQKNIRFVYKGMNVLTEHHGAFKAEMIITDDPSTGVQKKLMQEVADCDKILFAGEASSHCVKDSVEQFAFYRSHDIKKITLLTNTMSPVKTPEIDFTEVQNKFFTKMTKLGAKLATTVDVFT